jgi:hypothetical protein
MKVVEGSNVEKEVTSFREYNHGGISDFFQEKYGGSCEALSGRNMEEEINLVRQRSLVKSDTCQVIIREEAVISTRRSSGKSSDSCQ